MSKFTINWKALLIAILITALLFAVVFVLFLLFRFVPKLTLGLLALILVGYTYFKIIEDK